MRTNTTALQSDETVLFEDFQPRAMRNDLLTGLALARRSLVNAKKDVALGLHIDPEAVDQLEHIVAEYLKMLVALDRKDPTEF